MNKILKYSIVSIFNMLLISCNTGVESTKRITVKDVIKEIPKSKEEVFAEDYFRTEGCEKWLPGKLFIYIDDKLSVVLHPETPEPSDSMSLKGKIFTYIGGTEETVFGDKYYYNLIFECDRKKYRFETGKTKEEISEMNYVPVIPPLIALDQINIVKQLLENRILYIKTPIWYNDNGEMISGRKLIPVKITDAVPGNTVFPVRINFIDEQGNAGSVYMTLQTSSRTQYVTFDKLFSFDNPRLAYKNITDQVWDNITCGKVANGMTKEECQLSLGVPSEIRRIPTYSGLKEQWSYGTGTYLFFSDGVLVDYRL